MTKCDLSKIKIDLSDQRDLYKHLVASLTMSGASLSSWPTSFSRACSWYADLLGLGHNRLPFFLVHDLGLIFLSGNQFPFRALEGESKTKSEGGRERENKKILRSKYENRILNRILNLPIFYECADVIEETGRSPEVVGLFLERILAPLKNLPLPPILVTPHTVRSLSVPASLDPEKCAQEIDQSLRETFPDAFEEGFSMSFFEKQCEVVADAFEMLSLREALGQEDLFIARHYEIFGGRAQRLIARQVSEFEGLLGAAPSPPSDWVPETPEVKVELEDAGFFPQGGLDEMANRGSFENLVQSQLAMMENTEGPDLFSLRYVEGELLFYTRDEGQLLRRSRAVHLFLDLSEDYDFHYPGQPARLSVLLKAFLNRFLDDLFSVFETDSLRVIVHPMGPNKSDLSEFINIRFSERVERGEVSLQEEEKLDLETDPSPYVVPGRITTLLYIGPQVAPTQKIRDNHYRSNLGLFWANLDLEGEENWSDLEGTSQQQWEFKIGASTSHILPTLSALKTQLVWRNFGS